MPFTPFHLGPALVLGLPLRSVVHAPTFILANVIVDIEPLAVLLFNLNYPLHGYLHMFVIAIPFGIAIGYIMFLVERYFRSFYRALLLETERDLRLRSYLVAGAWGCGLHVLLDAPLYSDIRPFYPLSINPLYKPYIAMDIYIICSWLMVLGAAYYLGLVGLALYKKISG